MNPQRHEKHCAKGVSTKTANLVPVVLVAIEKEPSYGRFHPILFYPMLVYERLVNSCDAFRVFRANLFGVLQKASTSQKVN
jgi:hypothetical protein